MPKEHEEAPQGWQRDGLLLYTAQPFTNPSGRRTWCNRITVQVNGHFGYVDRPELDALAEQLHAFLAAPAATSVSGGAAPSHAGALSNLLDCYKIMQEEDNGSAGEWGGTQDDSGYDGEIYTIGADQMPNERVATGLDADVVAFALAAHELARALAASPASVTSPVEPADDEFRNLELVLSDLANAAPPSNGHHAQQKWDGLDTRARNEAFKAAPALLDRLRGLRQAAGLDAIHIEGIKSQLSQCEAALEKAHAATSPLGVAEPGGAAVLSIEGIKGLVEQAKKYRTDACKSILRNEHMNDLDAHSLPSDRQIDAVLVDFINYVALRRGMDLALYTCDLYPAPQA